MRDEKNRRPIQEAEADGLIEGRNAVIEALRSGTVIDKIYIARGETDATLGHIASTARGEGNRGRRGGPAQIGRNEPDKESPRGYCRGCRPGVRRRGRYSPRRP